MKSPTPFQESGGTLPSPARLEEPVGESQGATYARAGEARICLQVASESHTRLSKSRGVPTAAQPCAYKGSRARSTAVFLDVRSESPQRIQPDDLNSVVMVRIGSENVRDQSWKISDS